jgi:hypothetical protein
LNAVHTQEPRVISVYNNAAYPKAFDELKEKKRIGRECEITIAKVPQ